MQTTLTPKQKYFAGLADDRRQRLATIDARIKQLETHLREWPNGTAAADIRRILPGLKKERRETARSLNNALINVDRL